MDIVERLRTQGIKHPQQLEHWRDEAADEIERLRAELEAMTKYADKRNTAALDLQEQLEAVTKERDELAADAKRYRYIKAEIECSTGWLAVSNWDTVQWENFKAGADLDSAIDAALAKLGADKTGEVG